MAFPVIWQKLKDLAASVSGINESVSEVSESVSEVSAKVDGCLPLAGGTMSGAISASNPTGFDVGYSYSDRSGALIGLRNAGNTTYPGWFEIFARNASASSSLLGMPDGTLKWGGKNVFVGGYHTVEDTRSTSGSYTGLYVYGGRAGNGSGALLILRNKEATSEPGAFALQAHNGSSGRVFTGFPDGTLKWDGKNVLTEDSSSSGTYMRFSNGLQIVLGTVSTTANTNVKVTLTKAFKSTDYRVAVQNSYSTNTPSGTSTAVSVIGRPSASYFYVRTGNRGFVEYIAIGWWK